MTDGHPEPFTCEICGTEWEIDPYGAPTCPKCGQGYNYQEDITIELSEHQRQVLRDDVINNGGKVI